MALNSPRNASQLCFRALHMSKPQFHLDPLQVKVNLNRDIQEGVSPSLDPEERSQLLLDEAFSDRVDCQVPSAAFGMDGSIRLPKKNEQMFLGESIRWFVALSNVSNQQVSSVAVKLELQNERARTVLVDQAASSIATMAPGQIHEFVVVYLIKDSGPHTLICTSQFTPSNEMERKFNIRHFQFAVDDPLSMRTISKSMGLTTFLEVRVENAMQKPLILEEIEFHASELYQVEKIKPENASEDGPLKAYMNSLRVIQPNKGVENFMFKFTRIDESGAATEESRVLGKMEIKWKNGIGEPGRLFTQQIYAAAGLGLNRDIHGRVVQIDDNVVAYHPFKVLVQLWNKSKQAVGPLSLVLKRDKDPGDSDSAIVLNGLQSIDVEVLPPNSSCKVPLVMIALGTGVHTIQGLTLVHETDGFDFGSVASVQLFVAQCN